MKLAVFGALALALAGCSSSGGRSARAVKTGSVSYSTVSLMRANDMERQSPILIRVFKEEGELEVWKQERTGRYGLLKTYEICKFSGRLGPKIREGDRQAPEGFYAISAKSLNPYSRNHLAFDTGFPNAFDQSLGRTGSHLMVHGGCKSVGCYAMTHKNIEEIYGLLREALQNGQSAVLFQAFPFRMTAANMARHADDPNIAFWDNLKEGSDLFAATGRPPAVYVCQGRYGFARGAEPAAEVCAAQAGVSSYAAPTAAGYGAGGDAGGYGAAADRGGDGPAAASPYGGGSSYDDGGVTPAR